MAFSSSLFLLLLLLDHHHFQTKTLIIIIWGFDLLLLLLLLLLLQMADVLLRLRSLHSSSSSSPLLMWHQLPSSSFLIFTQTSLSPTRKNSNRRNTTTSSGLYSLLPKTQQQQQQPKPLVSWKVHATDGRPEWWERVSGPNMIDIHSTLEFLNALSSQADDNRLVIVEFYGTWCGSCRALFPKLCKIAQEHPEILFLKVNFDENKPMCKSLNVKVLPFFHFYRGADGMLESFSCSLAKLQKIKDAIATHNTARCSIGPPKGVGDVKLNESSPAHKDKPIQDS